MEEQKTELKMIQMSEVQSQEVKWLWYPFIPYGKLTIIQGDPGDGKTTLVLNIAAKGYNNHSAIHTTNHYFHQKCICPYNKSSNIIYSHIRHSSPIATFCYILLSDFLALVFALISFQGKNKHK